MLKNIDKVIESIIENDDVETLKSIIKNGFDLSEYIYDGNIGVNGFIYKILDLKGRCKMPNILLHLLKDVDKSNNLTGEAFLQLLKFNRFDMKEKAIISEVYSRKLNIPDEIIFLDRNDKCLLDTNFYKGCLSKNAYLINIENLIALDKFNPIVFASENFTNKRSIVGGMLLPAIVISLNNKDELHLEIKEFGIDIVIENYNTYTYNDFAKLEVVDIINSFNLEMIEDIPGMLNIEGLNSETNVLNDNISNFINEIELNNIFGKPLNELLIERTRKDKYKAKKTKEVEKTEHVNEDFKNISIDKNDFEKIEVVNHKCDGYKLYDLKRNNVDYDFNPTLVGESDYKVLSISAFVKIGNESTGDIQNISINTTNLDKFTSQVEEEVDRLNFLNDKKIMDTLEDMVKDKNFRTSLLELINNYSN